MLQKLVAKSENYSKSERDYEAAEARAARIDDPLLSMMQMIKLYGVRIRARADRAGAKHSTR